MQSNNYRYEREDLLRALEVLTAGGLILYPTDTIWGIGCDATNPKAVAKIYALKNRADAKAMISIVDSNAKLVRLMQEIPDISYDLIEATTTPLTIIYPNVRGLAPNLIADDGSAAIRVVESEPFCKALCERFRKPIVSTSANISGEHSPANFTEISQTIIDGVDYVVQYRQNDLSNATASNIIKLNADGTFVIIR